MENTIERNSNGAQVIENLGVKENGLTASISPIESSHDKWMNAMSTRIKTIASAKTGGVIQNSFKLNRTKLHSSVLNDYRMHNAGVYGKGEMLPSAIYDKIVDAVDQFIQSQINRINVTNVQTIREGYAYSPSKGITWKISAIGQEALEDKRKLSGCKIFIDRAERALKLERAKINNNLDKEQALEEKILNLNGMRIALEEKIAKATN